jgi:hypothetical protein
MSQNSVPLAILIRSLFDSAMIRDHSLASPLSRPQP